jgi:hypothetical protein
LTQSTIDRVEIREAKHHYGGLGNATTKADIHSRYRPHFRRVEGCLNHNLLCQLKLEVPGLGDRQIPRMGYG